jgi:vitamin B12 transporter
MDSTMTSYSSRARLAVLPLALAAAFPALAQTSTPETASLKAVVVTANRTEQPIGDVVADVTIIDRERIERSGAVGLADVLARVPGLEIARNGGVGNSTSVFIRGGETRHTLVLVDGVRMDTQNIAGNPNWQSIPLAQIDHIEIVRGPTSAVYGADAVAGVIQIFTKKGEGAFTPSITLGVGTYNTQTLDLAASGSSGALDYSVGVSGATSDGFNVQPTPGKNPDLDGYKSNNANLKLGFQLNAAHRVEAMALQSRMDAQYDGFVPLQNDRSINVLQSLGLQWSAQWTEQFSTRVALSQGVDQGEDVIGKSTNQTRINSLLWFNQYKLGAHAFSATLEQREDEFQLSGVPKVDRKKSQNGVGLGYGYSAGAHTVQINARQDNDSEFGNNPTGSLAYAFAFTPAWRVTASTGTSYKVPTLYQRFSQYGVATLKPESGRNNELGLRYAQGSSQYGVAVYSNKLTDLLNFSATAKGCASAFGCYLNTGEALYEGVTLTANERLGQANLYASLDVQNARDLANNNLLARRAPQHATLGADTRLGNWTVAGDLVLSGARYDANPNAVVLAGYGLLNLSASTQLSKDWKLTAKLDNVTNTVYQTANGYAMPGASAYVAVTWAPR